MKTPPCEQRPHISTRSAAGVITENSGSPAHKGHVPRVHPAKSLFAMIASADRERKGFIASTNTDSRPTPSG